MQQPSQQAADPAAVAASPKQVKQEELQPPAASALEHSTAVNTCLTPPPPPQQQQQQQQSFDAGQLQLRVPELLSLLTSCYALQQYCLKQSQASLNNWAKICGTDDLVELIRIGPEVLNSGLQDSVQRGQLTAHSAAQYLSRIGKCLGLQHVRSVLMCQSCAAAAEQQVAMQCSESCATGWQQLRHFMQHLQEKRREFNNLNYRQRKQKGVGRETSGEQAAATDVASESNSSSDDDEGEDLMAEPARKRQRLQTAPAETADSGSVPCRQAADQTGAHAPVTDPALPEDMQQQYLQQQQQQQQAALNPCTALPFTVLQQPAMHISQPPPAAAATGGSGGDMCGLPGPDVSLVKLEPADTSTQTGVNTHQQPAVMLQQQTVQQTAAAAAATMAGGQQNSNITQQVQPTVRVKSESGLQDSEQPAQLVQLQQQQQVNDLAALPVCQHIKIEPGQSTADDHHAQEVPEAAAAAAAPATECAAHSRGAHCGTQRMEGMPCQAAPGFAAAARAPATAAAEPTAAAAAAAAAQDVFQHTSSLPVLVTAASTQHKVAAAAVQVDTRTQEAPSSSTAAINNRDSNRREKSGNSSNNNAPCVDDAVLVQCKSKLYQLAEHAQNVGLELVDLLDSFSLQIDRLKTVQLGALLRVLQMLETQVLQCQMLLLQCLLQQHHQQRNIAGSSPAEAPIQCSSTEPPPAAAPAAAGSLLQQLIQCWDREVDQTGCTVDLAAAAARQRRVEDFTVDHRGFYIPANAYLAGLCELSMQLIVSSCCCCRCCCCELDAEQKSADGSRVEQLKHLAAHIVAGTAALLSNGQLVDQPAEKRTTKAMFWRGWLYRQCKKCNASAATAAAAVADDCIIAGGSEPGSISARQLSAMNSQVEQEVMKVFDAGI